MAKQLLSVLLQHQNIFENSCIIFSNSGKIIQVVHKCKGLNTLTLKFLFHNNVIRYLSIHPCNTADL